MLRQDTETETDVVEELGTAIETTSVPEFAWAALIVFGAVVVARIAKAVISRVLDNGPTDSLLGDLIGRLVAYVIVAFGVVYALETVGVAIGPVLGALGVIGLAVAFAMQSILENFVAGVLLQVRRPFTRGDEVRSLDYQGEIKSIDARSMTVLTPDGETVRLPNSEVLSNPIVNLTERGRRRTTVEVGVAYGTNLDVAVATSQQALETVETVRASPGPEVRVVRFGESSFDLALRFWHEPTIAGEWKARSDVILAVSRAFADANITIPFPQRTLRFAEESPVTVRQPSDVAERD